MYVLPAGTEVTTEILENFIKEHKQEVSSRLEPLRKLYEGKHSILDKEKKAQYKPDNRIVVNFAKYIVDTFNGFFIGIPIKISHEDDNVNSYLEMLDAYNNQDDNNAELSKIMSIYGRGYELLFMDEEAQVGITYVSPLTAFVIYDDSIVRRPMYGVRYYLNSDGKLEGSYSDKDGIHYFNDEYKVIEEYAHPFGDVPLIEYKENEEELGAFETVATMIDAYDKAISEKANDVDYYADAYLKILGAKLDEDTLEALRDNRIINISGKETEKVVVDFLQKPDSDATQEHLIDRLERKIFETSMVANINDENFGNSSGIALSYKLQSMNNLAKTKERKFIAGMNKRYKMIANVPTSKMGADDWLKLKFKFTRNMPKNILEEAQIAQQLSGITSEETQLSVLSIIDSPKDEMEAKNAESMAEMMTRTPETKQASMYEITSILGQRKRGSLTYNNALKMLIKIGVDEEEAANLLNDTDVIE